MKDESEVNQFLGGCEIFFILLDDKKVGYYAVKEESSDSSEIVGVVIIPEFQRRGIGATVVEKILQNLKTKKN